MRRSTLLAGLACLLLSASSYAQGTSFIAGGPHDLSAGSAVSSSNASINGQTCIFCHVPHGGANTIPLWNRQGPSAGSYTNLYSSTTMSQSESASNIVGGVSGACLSCHDGTIAMDVLTNVNGSPFGAGAKGGTVNFTVQGGAKSTYVNGTGVGTNDVMATGLPFLGTDLRNDHPVAVVYSTAVTADAAHYNAIQPANGGTSNWITAGSSKLPLYGSATASATVECSSCHGAHDNQLGNFLRVSNAGSAMCLACHKK